MRFVKCTNTEINYFFLVSKFISQTSESFYVDSSDCDELPEGSLARIQSQELLDQTLDGDGIPIGDDRKTRGKTFKRAPHARINRMEERANYDPHRVPVDNYNLTDDETNDDDIDDDVDQDDEGHGKFIQSVKDLTLSSNNVSRDFDIERQLV